MPAHVLSPERLIDEVRRAQEAASRLERDLWKMLGDGGEDWTLESAAHVGQRLEMLEGDLQRLRLAVAREKVKAAAR